MSLKTEKELSPNARSLWLKALSAFELKNYGYAISLLQGVVAEEPLFLKGRQLLRKAAFANTKGKKGFLSSLSGASLSGIKNPSLLKKDPVEAMKTAEKLLEVDPGSSSANNLLKDAALAAGFPEIAAFALETLREANPKDTKNLHELARHYYNHDLPDKAIEIYNAILAVNPSDIDATKGSKDASAKLTMKSSWEGKDSYRDIMKDKDQAVMLEQQNRVVKDEDVIEAQLAELGTKYEADNTNVEVVKKIANLYEQKGELSTAVSWYSYAASLGNNSDATLVRKATDLGLKILDMQLRDLSGWLKENDETNPEYAEKKGQYDSLKAHRAENQVAEAKRRVERNPTDLQLRYELGEVLMAAGQYREALPELQKARQNPNARIKALNLLAQCMVKLGMLDLAEGQFKTAISELTSMDDTKKDLLYNLGLTYEKLGKKDDYLDCMKRIFESDFGFRDVAERVEASYR